MNIPLIYCVTIVIMHGIGGWFDINFHGSDTDVVLSTGILFFASFRCNYQRLSIVGPDNPGTHWYQCRMLLREPIAVNRNQNISGKLEFTANPKFSYDIAIETRIVGTEILTTNVIKLHDQVGCSEHYNRLISLPQWSYV